MRASRTRIEASLEGVLTGPELARIVDAVLAGPFPEELAHILVERRVVERIASTMTAELDFTELVEQALARPEVRAAISSAASSEAVREALRQALDRQTASAGSDLANALRSHARSIDERVDLRHAPAAPQFGGVATRAIALAVDAALVGLIGISASAMITLIASLVG